jgi:hypothetical protein
MKKHVFLIFIFYTILLLAFPAYMVFRHYDTLINAEGCKFSVDCNYPNDPFRARYTDLRIQTQITRGFDNRSTYALILKDRQGFAQIVDVTSEKPKSKGYVKDLDLEQYCADNEIAALAEKISKDLNSTDSVYLLVKIKNGNHVISGLYINDIPVADYIASRN